MENGTPIVESNAAPELVQGTNLVKLNETSARLLAVSSKTPEVVKTALAPKDVAAAGRVFHPYTVQTHINLETLGSPFVQRGGTTAPTVKDTAQALWVMTTDDDEVERLLAAGGEPLRQTLMDFTTGLTMPELVEMAAKIGETIAAGFEPAAKMNPPRQEGGGSPLDTTSSATAPDGS